MADNRLESLLSNAELQPLLPVLYMGWTDGALAESERDGIRELARALPTLGDDAQHTLDAWLQSERPPSATEITRLRRHIREQVGQKRRTLAAISGAMQSGVSDALTDAVRDYERERNISGVGVDSIPKRNGEAKSRTSQGKPIA